MGEVSKRKYTLPIQRDEAADPEPEWNANQIAFQQEIAPIGREKLDWKNHEHLMQQLNERMDVYINACAKYSKKVGNLNCYLALGVNKRDVDLIIHGTFYKKIEPEAVDFFRSVKEYCGAYREGLASDGKINPVTAIFWQKNYDGLRDQQEVVTTIQDNRPEQSFEQLEDKYSKLIVTDAEIKD